jgi:Peptidase family C25
MLRFGPILALLLIASSAAGAADDSRPQWIVVVAPSFRDAVKPLEDQRRAQHFNTIQVLTTDVLSADEILAGDGRRLRAYIKKLCRDNKGASYVLLVGPVEAGRPEDAERTVVPPLDGGVGRMKGQPSDNGYGCFDDDHMPAVAVGRFPARTEREVARMVRKTLIYEGDDKPGEWRHRLTILAGIPAYNPFVDRLVESMAFSRLDRLDPSWTGRAIYSNPSSRFCVPDDSLRTQALKYVEEGEAWTLYLGHSNAGALWGGDAHYLDRDDWANLKIARGAGVFATCGCNGCQLKGDHGEGYGVAAMRNPSGPAAVIGSHGICFAAMVQLATDGLFESTFAGKSPERLGTAWLAIKAGLAKGKIDDLTYALLDRVDGDSAIPQATQRLEHLEMFTLLGDPALKLASTPADLTLKTEDVASAGKTVTIHGTAPARLNGGRVRVVAERPVSSTPDDLAPLPKQVGPERDRAMLRNHEWANRFDVASAETVVKDGHFDASLDMPAKMPWPRLRVRAYASTDAEEAIGVLTLDVQEPAKQRP